MLSSFPFAATEEESKKNEQVVITCYVSPQSLVARVDVSEMLDTRHASYVLKEKKSRMLVEEKLPSRPFTDKEERKGRSYFERLVHCLSARLTYHMPLVRMHYAPANRQAYIEVSLPFFSYIVNEKNTMQVEKQINSSFEYILLFLLRARSDTRLLFQKLPAEIGDVE